MTDFVLKYFILSFLMRLIQLINFELPYKHIHFLVLV